MYKRKEDIEDLLRGWKAGTDYQTVKKHTRHTLREQTKTIRIKYKGQEKSSLVHISGIKTRNADFVQLETPFIYTEDPKDYDTYLEAANLSHRTALDIIKSKKFPIWQLQLGAFVITYDLETGEEIGKTDIFSSGFIQDFEFDFKDLFDSWYNYFERLLQSKYGEAIYFYCKITLRK